MRLAFAFLLLQLLLYTATSSESFPSDVRKKTTAMYENGEMAELIEYLDLVEIKHSTLVDSLHPSLYAYRGVALYNARRMEEAERNFVAAVSQNPYDSRSWINLGELRVQTFNVNGAITAFNQAYLRGDPNSLGHLLRAKGWAADWRDFEAVASALEKRARKCTTTTASSRNKGGADATEVALACQGIDGSSGFEYTYLRGEHHRVGHAMSPNARNQGSKELPRSVVAPVSVSVPSVVNNANAKGGPQQPKRLKVGIVSSDFGVHPVSSLVRGAIQMVNKSKIELYCFSLQRMVSWWGGNISQSVEHFIHLPQVNTLDAAKEVARLGIEILIDLNGHTQFSGLRLMAHRPAPIQFSFLGLPTTTGSDFIDYYLGDKVALPPEHAGHFSESVSLLPQCYIVNDYAQLQGDLVDFLDTQRASRSEMVRSSPSSSGDGGGGDDDDYGALLEDAPLLFATLSNTQKLDPATFHVWMNIMRAFAGSKMVHVSHKGSDVAVPHIHRTAEWHGVSPDAIVMAAQAPWIDHLYRKTAIDLILDTGAKNGHTTGLDGLWAGVPTMSFATGQFMSTRAAESIHDSLGTGIGLSYSCKDYEDTVRRVLVHMLSSKSWGGSEEDQEREHRERQREQTRLQAWRGDVHARRTSCALFDTPQWTRSFERQLQLAWDVAALQDPAKKRFHLIVGTAALVDDASTGAGASEGRRVRTDQVYTPDSRYYNATVGVQRRGEGITVVASTPQPPVIAEKIIPSPSPGAGAGAGAGGKTNGSGGDSVQEQELEPLPAGLLQEDYIFLNIGGISRKEGWYNVNSQRRIGVSSSGGGGGKEQQNNQWRNADVDVIRLMDDLVGIPNDTVSAVYASHILEHASFGDGHLENTLQEWRRVLRPGGMVLISVPDLMTVFQLYLKQSLTLDERWLLTRVIYGAQSDQYDYHKIGFDETILTAFLAQNGFCGIERVGSFNLFDDSSEIVLHGVPISLNVAAKKCRNGDKNKMMKEDDFSIDHHASPYQLPVFPHEHLCEACESGGDPGEPTESTVRETASKGGWV